MIVHVDDALFEQCGGEEGIVKILKIFGKYELGEKTVVLSKEETERVQRATDSVVGSGKDIVKIVEGLSAISVNGARFTFTPQQLTRLKEQADFYERTLKEYATEVVGRKMAELFGEV